MTIVRILALPVCNGKRRVLFVQYEPAPHLASRDEGTLESARGRLAASNVTGLLGMNNDDITLWIDGLSGGDQRAAEALWRTYFDRLVRLARQRLAPGDGRHADEEDAALSAMHSFYRGVRSGRYPQLAGRDELWRLLVTIVLRKVSHQRRDERRKKRGGGRTRGESAFVGPDDDREARGIEQVLGNGPTAEAIALLSENCLRLLDVLDDDTLRQIARWKLEGFTNDEIAAQLDCTTRRVERKLKRIRELWSERAEQT